MVEARDRCKILATERFCDFPYNMPIIRIKLYAGYSGPLLVTLSQQIRDLMNEKMLIKTFDG